MNPEDVATHFGSYLDKYAANATHEQVPGAGTGQLEGIVDASAAERANFSNDPNVTWMDERGRDKMYAGSGMATAQSRPATGIFTPKGTNKTEFNPMEVARPLASRVTEKYDSGKVDKKGNPIMKPTGEVRLGDWDRELLDSGEALRAFIDAQNAGAWNAELPGNSAKFQKGVAVDMGKRPSADVVAELNDLALSEGFFASDTGAGVNFINDLYSPKGKSREGKDLGKDLRGSFGKKIQEISGVKPVRSNIESGFRDFEKEWTQGKGAATRKLFETLDTNPTAAAQLDSPQVRQKALDNIKRDADYGEKMGLPVREDIQHTRRIYGEEGLEGLRRELELNPDLLASAQEVLAEAYS